MCLILLGWQVHPDYPLIVAANRDEFYSRPAAAAAFWPDAPEILAGRDLDAGGTWLGITRQLRFAALTNYREGGQQQATAPSRGALVADFLAGNEDPEAYLARLAARGQDYNGFNLLFGDDQRLGYFTNRGNASDNCSDNRSDNHCTNRSCNHFRWLAPGIYGLSNHLLDTPWPKLAAARIKFKQALSRLPATDDFLALLADQEIVADAHLPQTGVPLAWERTLSAIFVNSPENGYGTRASTVLSRQRTGHVSLHERSFGPGAEALGEVSKTFQSSLLTTQ
jgi:uncharacterized protein with NRDE domain